ncbi:serine/threonine-protein kinase-2 [Elsinoe australis]|uniref:non-specific serine/threonine protein kinase n=1 Tax=Elsinoe australis TaxID=40998 RepID=A0A4U7B829_9PEZI|nr:serine/threonine-protein kinase-2 [Elsinoe australis]
MGQGYSAINPSAGSAGIDSPEVADLEYERTLLGARFLKTIRARHKDGVVVVKVYTKPFGALKLDERIQELIHERRELAEVPNALPYHRLIETSTSAYLVRQYVHSSLYDRISTNPPLEDIERKWIAFQLLCAVRDCHARNIYHGDIKTENMLVTSWNWLYLTDFAASIKPHFLPEDNPVDYTLYYDTTVRRICYIAPERFTSTHETSDEHKNLQWAMDIFSVGCVIAELFTEKPTFTLTQLFRYRKGDFDPSHGFLGSIKDDHIREMVTHMISIDPNDRYSAQEYLDFWKEKAFPLYFYTFLHQYTHLITDPTSGQKPVVAGKSNTGGSDDRIDRIYNDYDKISYALGFDNSVPDILDSAPPKTLNLHLFPMQVDIPDNRHTAADRAGPDSDNGALLFSNIVIASLRSTARATSRLKGCELLLTFGEHLTDEAKLDRVLPYAMALLEDDVPAVRISALRTITQLLSLVTVLSPMNAFIFPRYILPRLSKFVSSAAFNEHPPIRATYAACLADLANTASRFLDMTQALRADGSLPSIDPEAEDDVAAYAAYQLSYDVTREELIQQFEAQTKIFLTDADPAVRRAFLGSVGGLCLFFGDSLASDLILTHLNTYLNDEDWTLKCALCETIVGVAAFIGGASLEDFILPLLIQALTDPEETVTEQVIRSLASMAKLGLFQRWIVLELVLIVVRFTLHPNHWIREAAAQFVSNAASQLSYADFRSLIEPLIRPVLKVDVPDAEENTMLDSLKKPLPRAAMDLARVWAVRSEKGTFWKPAQKAKSFSFDASSNKTLMDLYRGVTSLTPTKSARSDEDEQWMTRMRNAGMRAEDETKLLALRDYIWRVVIRTEKEGPDSSSSPFNHIISLTSLKVPLQNVLFDDDLRYYDQIAGRQDAEQKGKTTTLAEALSEATTATGSLNDVRSAAGSRTLSAKPSVETERPTSRASSDVSQSTATTRTPSTALRIDGRATAARAVSSEHMLSSSPASQLSSGSRGHVHARNRESAIGLMKRGDTMKASAETGTDSANAVGRVDVPMSGRATPNTMTPSDRSPSGRTAHTYDGGDPTVQKYLDNVYTSNFPIDLAEFGPRIQSVKRAQIANSTGHDPSGRWRPQGLLVAAIGEHTDQVNSIAVSSDHIFFVTGSADGTVRVWDVSRLERNITHRARQVHRHRSGAPITSLCFVENSHCFISCASDGSINVVKVDVTESAGTTRYGKLQVLRDWTIPAADSQTEGDAEHAIAVDHFRDNNQSQCVLLTSRSRFLNVDLRHMTLSYSFSNPVSHGTPTAFVVHRRRQWLLIGTSHGVLDLWDLRFRLRLRSWTFRDPSPITKLAMHPGRRNSHRMRICISGGTGPGHVSMWDIEKPTCFELYAALHSINPTSSQDPKISARDLALIPLDDEHEPHQLDHFVHPSTSTPSQPTSPTRAPAAPSNHPVRPSSKTHIPGSTRDFIIQMHHPSPTDVSTSANDSRHHFLLTAGPEWKTRFWDPEKLGNSAVVNSGAIEGFSTASESEGMNVVAERVGAETRVYLDTVPGGSSGEGKASGAASVSSSPAKRRGAGERSVSSAGGRGVKESRYDVIRNSAHYLLKGHRDEITSLALVERPFGMVVTGDRGGGLYIFQ